MCCVLPAVVAALVSAVVNAKLFTYELSPDQLLVADAVRSTLHVTTSSFTVPAIPMGAISRSCTSTP